MNRKLIAVVIVLFALLAFSSGYLLNQHKTQNTTSSNITTAVPNNGKALDLSGQQLTSLPDSVTSQSDVTSLNISNNQLTSLPSSISKMTNLETLNVENNRLVSLPPEIGQLKKLKNADFSNNRLVNLPQELGSLTQLQNLNLNSYKGPTSDLIQLKSQLPNTQLKT